MSKHFETVGDFRTKGRCLHELSDILIIVLCGILADCSDFTEIEDYAREKEVFFREDLGLQLPNGIPSDDTLWRVTRHLKSEELEKSLASCAAGIMSGPAGRHLSIDGKEMRGTTPQGKKHALVQVVSLWLDEGKLSFGQVRVGDKSNEITAIPELLGRFSCAGAIISIDAIGCQKTIVEKISEEKADYVIALKKNQGVLYEQASAWLMSRKSILPCHKEIDLGHGRGESRAVYVCGDTRFVEAAEGWAGLSTIVMSENVRLVGGREETSTKFYISSLKNTDPAVFAKTIRGHWGIENGLHWQLDFTFKEDRSQVKKDNGPANLNIFRKFALFLLSKEPSQTSIKRKRKKAGRDDKFLLNILKSA